MGPLTIDLIDFALVHERGLDVSKISRAEVGIYELSSSLQLSEFKVPGHSLSNRRCDQNQIIIKVKEPESHVFISACIEADSVAGLSVLVVEPENIIVVNVRGDFDAMIESLVQESTGSRLLAFSGH